LQQQNQNVKIEQICYYYKFAKILNFIQPGGTRGTKEGGRMFYEILTAIILQRLLKLFFYGFFM
jgi:hypothetical protein